MPSPYFPLPHVVIAQRHRGQTGRIVCIWLQVLFDKQRLELVRRVEMGSTVAALLWHERLNQIIVGTGRALPLSVRLLRYVAGGHTQLRSS